MSHSSLHSATKGLTLFAMPPLSDAEFDCINKASQVLEVATQTTVKDVTSNGFEAEAPSSFSALTIWIKKFNNLIFALFGENCSLFSELGEIVTYLDDYGDEVIRNTTKRTLATILWIIHLQARYFSVGKMTGPKKLLPVFTLMPNAVQTKQPVVYGEVPRKLYEEQEEPAVYQPNNRKRSGRPQEQEYLSDPFQSATSNLTRTASLQITQYKQEISNFPTRRNYKTQFFSTNARRIDDCSPLCHKKIKKNKSQSSKNTHSSFFLYLHYHHHCHH